MKRIGSVVVMSLVLAGCGRRTNSNAESSPTNDRAQSTASAVEATSPPDSRVVTHESPSTYDNISWDKDLASLIKTAHDAETGSQFAEAASQWQRIRQKLVSVHDEHHWQVVNCDMAMTTDQTLAAMTAQDLQRYSELLKLDQQAERQAMTGALRNALGLVKQAKPLARQLFGPLGSVPLSLQLKAAQLALRLNDLDAAFDELQDYVDKAHQVYTASHPDLESALFDLGSIEHRRGHNGRAVVYLDESLRMAKQLYGQRDLAVARRANDLGVALHAEGRFDESLAALAEAESIRRGLAGENLSLVAECVLNQAAVYIDQQDWQTARQKYEAILQMNDKAEIASAIVQEARSRLASIFTVQKDFSHAAELLQQVLDSIDASSGDLNPEYAAYAYRLGMNLGFQKKFTEAESVLRHALTVQTNLIGGASPEARKSATALIAVLQRLDRADEANQIAQQFSISLAQESGELK